MAVYCESCGTERKDDSRICKKCGNKFGGELWVLAFGVVLGIIFPLAAYLGIKTGAIQGGLGDPLKALKILVMWELPIWTLTAVCYDHSRLRSQIYFWVGGFLSLLGVIWANS